MAPISFTKLLTDKREEGVNSNETYCDGYKKDTFSFGHGNGCLVVSDIDYKHESNACVDRTQALTNYFFSYELLAASKKRLLIAQSS